MSTPLSGMLLSHFLMTGAILFGLGLIGFVTRRNLIIMFLCTELMFQGVVISLVSLSLHHGNFEGQTFVIFVLTIAAAEAALALGLVVLLYRGRKTLDGTAWALLRG